MLLDVLGPLVDEVVIPPLPTVLVDIVDAVVPLADEPWLAEPPLPGKS